MQYAIRSLVVVGMLMMAVLLSVGAEDSRFLSSSLFSYPVMDENGTEIEPSEEISGSLATLRTTAETATMMISTNNLVLGEAVTSWWVIFNYPENCSDDECGADDVSPPRNPDIGISVLLGDGEVIGEDGKGFFLSTIDVGDASNVVFGPGLTNPFGAEIHYVLRSHGPAQDEVLEEQLTTINGGCEEDAPHEPCYDAQYAILKDGE